MHLFSKPECISSSFFSVQDIQEWRFLYVLTGQTEAFVSHSLWCPDLHIFPHLCQLYNPKAVRSLTLLAQWLITTEWRIIWVNFILPFKVWWNPKAKVFSHMIFKWKTFDLQLVTVERLSSTARWPHCFTQQTASMEPLSGICLLITAFLVNHRCDYVCMRLWRPVAMSLITTTLWLFCLKVSVRALHRRRWFGSQ